jgi:hypothetical protein
LIFGHRYKAGWNDCSRNCRIVLSTFTANRPLDDCPDVETAEATLFHNLAQFGANRLQLAKQLQHDLGSGIFKIAGTGLR